MLNQTWERTLQTEHLLYQTTPVLSPTTSIKYLIAKTPQYGFFFSSVSKYQLRQNDIFTQEDITLGNLKYKLYRKSYSYVVDTALLTVMTPGCKNVTANVTMAYSPLIENSFKINVVLKRLQIDEGGSVNIDESHLSITSDSVTSLFFNVTQAPSHGTLQVLKNGILRNNTTYFTSSELKASQLFYVHDDSESERDHFRFMALSSEEENFEYVESFHIDILLKNDNSPMRINDKVFHVVVGGQRLLTGDILKYQDIDLNTTPKDITYNCRDMPNGELYNSKHTNQKLEEFTQDDLDNGLVLFKHKGPEYGKIQLWVTDGQFYVNGILEVQASAPFVQVITSKKLIVQQGHSAVFSNVNIRYDTNLFASDDDVLYEVVAKAIYGKIVRTGTTQELGTFTQADIESGAVSYHNNLSTASADQIELRVRCRDAVSVAQLGIWMLPAVYWEPLQLKMSRSLVVEESTSALINKMILEVRSYFSQ